VESVDFNRWSIGNDFAWKVARSFAACEKSVSRSRYVFTPLASRDNSAYWYRKLRKHVASSWFRNEQTNANIRLFEISDSWHTRVSREKNTKSKWQIWSMFSWRILFVQEVFRQWAIWLTWSCICKRMPLKYCRRHIRRSALATRCGRL